MWPTVWRLPSHVFDFRGFESAFPAVDMLAGKRRKSRREAMGALILCCAAIEEEEAAGRREAHLGQ